MTNSNLVACTTGKFRRLLALEDATGIDTDLAMRVGDAGAVAHQPAGLDKFTH